MFDGWRADPRHLLRHAADDGDARRRSRAGAASRVRPGEHPHHARTRRCSPSVPEELRVWASHGDFVAAAPAGFAVTATSANAPVAAMAAPDRRMYALLFHPEVAHTDRGTDILRNFAYEICGCTGDWTMASFVKEATDTDPRAGGGGECRLRLERRRRFDGGGHADSPRDRRSADVHLRRQRRDAHGRGGADPQRASSGCSCRWCSSTRPDLFLDRLAGVTDPEQKRKIIGAHVHRGVRGASRRSWARSISWDRARCIPT